MIYNYSEVIPYLLFLPVMLNIIFPLGMLAVYLLIIMMKSIFSWLKPRSDKASKPGLLVVADEEPPHKSPIIPANR